ncbi:hypothetical protein C3920_08405 [Novacetimonas pomaceti]|uniref:Uncharacterized protein n=1 Tax=Novacetimonas pomaceti TaxID=2021998 RepID=A0ABX5P764_9PROT|nr:hypothetical protein C3920_08405 [Novacetimonas pomaceti]
MKLFSKSFERRRLFEKRRHPRTFTPFLSMRCFQTISGQHLPSGYAATGRSGTHFHPPKRKRPAPEGAGPFPYVVARLYQADLDMISSATLRGTGS